MNNKTIQPKLVVIFLLLSFRALFAQIALDTIMKLTYLSPENNALTYFHPEATYTDYQWNTVQTNIIGSLDKFRIDTPLSHSPNFEQVTVITFVGWPITVDSIIQSTGTVTIGYDTYQNPIQVYYHLTDYYGYTFPPPQPHPVDEIKICAMPKTANTVLFFRNILHTDAAPPSFTNQPQSGTRVIGTRYSSLSGTARVDDGGTLSYQWYSNTTAANVGGTVIDGVTDAYFNPTSDIVGTYYYYVVVTNTNETVSGNKTASAVSNVATITVVDPNSSVSLRQDRAVRQSLRASGNTLHLNLSERGSVSIYSLTGARVRAYDLSGGSHALRLNSLPRGTYVVRANSGAWSRAARVLVK